MIVDKKHGSERFFVDFRKFNKITKRNIYPLSDILALL